MNLVFPTGTARTNFGDVIAYTSL